MAAECVTAAQCALTIRHSTGILCAPMTAERAKELQLPRMVKKNQDVNGTSFTVTCDSIRTTTGVSAVDRTRTFHDLANIKCGAPDFNRPGHVFPLIAKSGGVRERRGHTEAGVDLCMMAGKSPVALIAELCNDDGTMMRLADCARFAKDNGIPLITVDAMVKYLEEQEPSSKPAKKANTPSALVFSQGSAKAKEIDDAMVHAFGRVGCLPIPPLCVVTDENGLITGMNNDFIRFTGYNKAEMLGRKCNFLQGVDTDPQDVADIRSALEAKQRCSVVILNYTKTGNRFWNLLSIRPMMGGANGKMNSFIGDIISLPIPGGNMEGGGAMTIPHLAKPNLCVDDVLALLSVLNSIPRSPVSVVGVGADAPVSPSGGGHFAWPEGNKKLEDIGANMDFVASTMLPTSHGRFRVLAYRDRITKAEPIVLQVGDVVGKGEVPVRVHDQCLTSEVFGSLRCDCRQQLHSALKYVRDKKCGAVIYLPQEGRGIGLANKVAAYAMQELGLDTVDANRELGLPDDARQYDCVGAILKHMEVESVALISNNPRKFECLKKAGVKVMVRIPCVVPPETVSEHCRQYVNTKTKRMGHMSR
jgi:GTP cyclohydrolase II/3,4-dihydroxy-2-butanone 4-phosphate synthase